MVDMFFSYLGEKISCYLSMIWPTLRKYKRFFITAYFICYISFCYWVIFNAFVYMTIAFFHFEKYFWDFFDLIIYKNPPFNACFAFYLVFMWITGPQYLKEFYYWNDYMDNWIDYSERTPLRYCAFVLVPLSASFYILFVSHQLQTNFPKLHYCFCIIFILYHLFYVVAFLHAVNRLRISEGHWFRLWHYILALLLFFPLRYFALDYYPPTPLSINLFYNFYYAVYSIFYVGIMGNPDPLYWCRVRYFVAHFMAHSCILILMLQCP